MCPYIPNNSEGESNALDSVNSHTQHSSLIPEQTKKAAMYPVHIGQESEFS